MPATTPRASTLYQLGLACAEGASALGRTAGQGDRASYSERTRLLAAVDACRTLRQDLQKLPEGPLGRRLLAELEPVYGKTGLLEHLARAESFAARAGAASGVASALRAQSFQAIDFLSDCGMALLRSLVRGAA